MALQAAAVPTPHLTITRFEQASPTGISHRLEKRDLDTVGWIAGDPASPVVCPTGYTFTIGPPGEVQFTSRFKCSNQLSATNDWYACINHGAPASTPSSLYISCPQSTPSCVTYFKSSNPGPYETYTYESYGCGSVDTRIQVYATTTTNNAGASTSTAMGSAAPTASIPTSTPGNTASSATSTPVASTSMVTSASPGTTNMTGSANMTPTPTTDSGVGSSTSSGGASSSPTSSTPPGGGLSSDNVITIVCTICGFFLSVVLAVVTIRFTGRPARTADAVDRFLDRLLCL